MTKVRQIFIRQKAAEAGYFSANCCNGRAMKNVTNFYIRNTASGIRKSPEERTANETEVLHFVFVGIQKANKSKDERFKKDTEKIFAENTNVMKRNIAFAELVGKFSYFEYPTPEKWFLFYEVLDAIFKETKNEVYYSLPAQVNQKAIKEVCISWKSYFKALKKYKESPSKFTGKPKFPGYIKTKETTVTYSNQVAKLKEIPESTNKKNVISFPNSKVVIKVGKVPGKYVNVKVKQCFGGYKLLISYEVEVDKIKASKKAKRIFGIDVGVDNLVAVANNVGAIPFIVKGGAVKAINQWFNKRKAELLSTLTKGKDSTHSKKESKALSALSRKRESKLRDFFYKTAHYICRAAKALEIEVIVAGYNEGIKNQINIGKTNNQNFVSIPFDTFFRILEITAWSYGIAFVKREESYTSKASLIDMDKIPTYKKPKNENSETAKDTKDEKESKPKKKRTKKEPVFSGKRIHRGLYQTKEGILINADINAAGNIIRKEYKNAFKDQSLEYLYKTTNVVNYKDIYKQGTPNITKAKKAALKQRMHKPSDASKLRKNQRWARKINAMHAILDIELEEEKNDKKKAQAAA